MKYYLLAGMFLLTTSAFAAVEKEYDPSKPMATTPWFARSDDAARRADLEFVRGMRPHHVGALTMSQEYLSSKESSHPTLKKLARGIIHNQTFEIGVLDTIEAYAKDGTSQIAAEGQAQRQKFLRAPVPASWDVIAGDRRISARDIQFAKAMIVHHQAAVDMCRAYNANLAVRNLYLQQICLDIIVDQQQDIKLMQKVIVSYPDDADKITITPDMVHGMAGMVHGTPSHGGHHGDH